MTTRGGQMANNLAHFSIHADDVKRAKKFYEDVFGWKFNPYGPPDFYQIQTGTNDNPGVRGALQKRNLPKGIGFECTISVESLDKIEVAIKKNGGRIVMERAQIPKVGTLIKFEDTEGNISCAMRYEILL